MVAAIVWQPSKHTIHFPSFKKPAPIAVPINLTDPEVLESDSEPMGASLDQNDPQFQAPKDEIEQQLVQAHAETESKHRVASGETLGVIFSQYGLPISEMYRLIDANKSVQQLRVGQTLEWEVDADGKLTSLSIIRSKKVTDTYTLTKKGYVYKEVEQKGDIKPVTLTGRVSGSFYNSARDAGLTPTQIDRRPGAKTLLSIRESLKNNQAYCVFSEPQFSPAVVKSVTKGTNVKIGTLDPMATDIVEGKGGYVRFLNELGQRFSKCLN